MNEPDQERGEGLEARLRAALDARAQTFDAAPDAWARLERRAPRHRRLRWALAALPVALLASFVPALLGGGRGEITANDVNAIHQRLMRDRTAMGERVTLDNPAEGRPLHLWFAKARLGYPELCYVVERSEGPAFGDCGGLRLLSRSVPGWYEGTTQTGGAAVTMDYGVALPEVTAVTGVGANGRGVPGTLLRPAGAPYVIWAVSYPSGEKVSSVRLSGSDGKVLDELSRMILPAARAAERTADRPAGDPLELPEGLVVQPRQVVDGRALRWTRRGAPVGQSSLQPQYLLKEAPVQVRHHQSTVFGVARADVARLTFTGGTGQSTSARAVPDPWNLGLVLFAGQKPDGWDESHRTTAYDAAGRELWHDDWSPPEDPGPERRVSEIVAVPGTADFTHGPVRLWFTEEAGENVLCSSGGVTPIGERHSSCGMNVGGPDSFSLGWTITYLPEPGVKLVYGMAGPGWRGVDAVLPDGRRIPARFLTVPGGPARVWYVRHPLTAEIAAYAIEQKGRRLEDVHFTEPRCRPAKQADGRADGQAHALDSGVTAVLQEGNCATFWKDGRSLPNSFETIPGGRLADTIADERPIRWSSDGDLWYGFTLAGTARIEITLPGGGTGTAVTVPDPWGQGVALFSGSRSDGDTFVPGMTFTGYGPDGAVKWTYEPEGYS
ncbi:hypothetical protein HII36_01800 [Nonomuraea sp. NN258]|uniref:hypothetical protein n=1 Tax=Nonomuraea antri TaxID=2730852 RepID=UPI0015698D62|nr:hypothetical protein [Nonomuraea antri]NRQ30581.1 hypothetical protein [Nonomuraea antri]